MKIINISILTLTIALLISCEEKGHTEVENGNSNQDSTTVIENTVELDLGTKTEYSQDSSFRMEYQYDKKTGKKYGLYKEIDQATETLLVERTYKEDKIDGVERYYHENGKVDGEFSYKDGIHEGDFVYYGEDGTMLQKGTYKEGKVEGILYTYYPNSALKEEVMHVAGFTEGPFKEYNENGTIKAKGAYTSKSERENLEHGPLELYDENGTLDRKMICKAGKCCTTWTSEDGDVPPINPLCEGIIKEYNEVKKE